MDNFSHRDNGSYGAINGRFLIQRMSGFQRYAFQIVAALDDLLAQNRESAAVLAMRLVEPRGQMQLPLSQK
jgi:hypothetical protein